MEYAVLLSVVHFKTILLVDPDWLLKVSHQSAAGSLRATQRAKRGTPTERAMKTEKKNSVRLFVAFFFTYFCVLTSSDFLALVSSFLSSVRLLFWPELHSCHFGLFVSSRLHTLYLCVSKKIFETSE